METDVSARLVTLLHAANGPARHVQCPPAPLYAVQLQQHATRPQSSVRAGGLALLLTTLLCSYAGCDHGGLGSALRP